MYYGITYAILAAITYFSTHAALRSGIRVLGFHKNNYNNWGTQVKSGDLAFNSAMSGVFWPVVWICHLHNIVMGIFSKLFSWLKDGGAKRLFKRKPKVATTGDGTPTTF